MLARLAAAGAAIGTLLVATHAQAQEKAGSLGEQGQFIFSANRLFDLFAYTNNKSTPDNTNNNDTTVSATSGSLFYGSNTTAISGNNAAGVTDTAGVGTFFTVPRLGFDYTIIPNLTIGGDLVAFFSLGGSAHTNPANTSTDLPSGNVLGIAPRVGYVIGLSDIFSIWLRGGLHFYTLTVNQPNQGGPANQCSPGSFNAHVFGFDLDPQLVISPVAHFGFMVGPALDWAPLGGYSVPTPVVGNCGLTSNGQVQSLHFGITSGLLGWW